MKVPLPGNTLSDLGESTTGIKVYPVGRLQLFL